MEFNLAVRFVRSFIRITKWYLVEKKDTNLHGIILLAKLNLLIIKKESKANIRMFKNFNKHSTKYASLFRSSCDNLISSFCLVNLFLTEDTPSTTYHTFTYVQKKKMQIRTILVKYILSVTTLKFSKEFWNISWEPYFLFIDCIKISKVNNGELS